MVVAAVQVTREQMHHPSNSQSAIFIGGVERRASGLAYLQTKSNPDATPPFLFVFFVLQNEKAKRGSGWTALVLSRRRAYVLYL